MGKSRYVYTPKGKFKSQAEAARAHDISRQAVHQKVVSRFQRDWYLGEESSNEAVVKRSKLARTCELSMRLLRDEVRPVAVALNYFVDRQGRLWNRRGKEVGVRTNDYYITVCLDGKYHYLHRLVAAAFLPNNLRRPCVNHINGNKSDNRVENLEWVSYLENTTHAIDCGLREGNRRLTEEQVIDIYKKVTSGVSWEEVEEEYNISKTTVYKIKNKHTHKKILENVKLS